MTCLLFNTCLQTKTYLRLQNDYLKNKVTIVPAFAFEQQTLRWPFPVCVSLWGSFLRLKVNISHSNENTHQTRKTNHLSAIAVICCVIFYEAEHLHGKIKRAILMRTISALMGNETGSITISIHSGHVNLMLYESEKKKIPAKQNSRRGNQPLDSLFISEI